MVTTLWLKQPTCFFSDICWRIDCLWALTMGKIEELLKMLANIWSVAKLVTYHVYILIWKHNICMLYAIWATFRLMHNKRYICWRIDCLWALTMEKIEELLNMLANIWSVAKLVTYHVYILIWKHNICMLYAIWATFRQTHKRYITAKTSWLFQPQSGYPGCRQTGETEVARGLLWCWRLIA